MARHIAEKLRERSFARQIMTPRTVTRYDLKNSVHHDQLAVQDRRTGRDPDGQPGQLRQRAREIDPVSADDPDRSRPGDLGRPDHHECPLTAPPRLEQVLRRIERVGQCEGEHRPQVRWLRQAVLGPVEREGELVGHGPSMVR